MHSSKGDDGFLHQAAREGRVLGVGTAQAGVQSVLQPLEMCKVSQRCRSVATAPMADQWRCRRRMGTGMMNPLSLRNLFERRKHLCFKSLADVFVDTTVHHLYLLPFSPFLRLWPIADSPWVRKPNSLRDSLTPGIQVYNAHSTAVDAIWAGLPLVTTTRERMAARVAASALIGGPPTNSIDVFFSNIAFNVFWMLWQPGWEHWSRKTWKHTSKS